MRAAVAALVLGSLALAWVLWQLARALGTLIKWATEPLWRNR